MSEKISFEIKALQSDATTPISNAEIQLENINLGQKYKTNDNGIASFEIESTQHLKSFRAKLIHKDYQEYPIADRPITLNSIRRREKPLELRFREKIWLLFNGESLSIMSGKDKILKNYVAFSGKALNPQEAKSLQQESNYTRFVTYTDKGLFSDEILYFCLDKDYQKDKDKGAMPEGIYYININDINTRWTIFSENTFGKNTKIYTNKDCTNTIESTTNRDNFYLHGGDKYGNAGGIDLAKEDTSFFNYLSTLKATHICDNIYATKEEKCVLKLVVEYESLESLIEKLRIELNYLTESVYAMFAKEFIRIPQLRTEYQTAIRQMSNEILTIVDKEQDKAKKYMLAKQYSKESYLLRNQILNDIRNKSSEFAKALAKSEKPVLPSFESLIVKKMQQNNFSGEFENLSLEQKIKVYRDIIDSSKSTRKSVNDKIPYYRFFGYAFIVTTMAYVGYDLYYSDDKLKTAIKHTNTIGFGLLGGSIGTAMAVDTCDINPICYAGFAFLGSLIGSSIGNLVNDSTDFILRKYGYE